MLTVSDGLEVDGRAGPLVSVMHCLWRRHGCDIHHCLNWRGRYRRATQETSRYVSTATWTDVAVRDKRREQRREDTTLNVLDCDGKRRMTSGGGHGYHTYVQPATSTTTTKTTMTRTVGRTVIPRRSTPARQTKVATAPMDELTEPEVKRHDFDSSSV